MEGLDAAVHSALGDLCERLHVRLEVEAQAIQDRLKEELRQLWEVEAQAFVQGVCRARSSQEMGASPNPVSPTLSLSMKVLDGDPEVERSPEDGFNQRPPNDAHKAMLTRSDSYEHAQARAPRPLRTKIRTMTYEFKYSNWKEAVTTLAHSAFFDLFWALVIASNAIYLGVTLSIANQENLMAVHVAYAILFAVELLMRLLSVGCRQYLWGPGWTWNWLDVIVVSSSWLDILLDVVGSWPGGESVGSSFRVLRLLRVSRLLRIVKTLWIIRFVGALRTLVSSLVDTLKPLFWAMLLLLIIIYIAGVLFTDVALQHHAETGDGDHHHAMMRFFGSLGLSVQTLFRAISGGIDWAEAAEALRPLGDFWVLLFQVYVAFCMFAVLNVMTGVFCHSAIKSAEQDHENRLDNRQEFRQMISDIFQRLDDGDGQLTLAEFEMMFENEGMQAFLETAEINASDAWTLFASLDVDGDHLVDVEEFTKRCMSLRGPARSMDVFALTRHNLKIRDQLRKVDQKLTHLNNLFSRDDSVTDSELIAM
ncbi:Sodium channel protein type 4 subunit alpha A (Voltage-gated sodium channel subunit alpha Nav1.4a) [Durusdinium trenchii]|uniref:Sodium channel protein type 4 subunit alpha A (Voltage-gated sodium channel subunit alpha Nav1.4a) n=1 Tax=Durusdinium trenchii TaxID=1381693 RepID=A0ABP0M486_9DINO